MARKHVLIAMFAAMLMFGTACSSGDDSADETTDESPEVTESAGSDDGSEADESDGSLEEGWVLAEVTAGDVTFEVEAICATNGDNVTLTTDSVENSVAVEQASGTIVVRVVSEEDPTESSLWSATGAEVTVEGGKLTATGTATPILPGGVIGDAAEVTVTADCPDA